MSVGMLMTVNQVNVPLSAEDWTYITGAAQERGQSMAEFMREAVIAHAAF